MTTEVVALHPLMTNGTGHNAVKVAAALSADRQFCIAAAGVVTLEGIYLSDELKAYTSDDSTAESISMQIHSAAGDSQRHLLTGL